MANVSVEVVLPPKSLALRTRKQWSRFLSICAHRDTNRHLSMIEADDRLRAVGLPTVLGVEPFREDPTELTYY
jgi:hypothetical protein